MDSLKLCSEFTSTTLHTRTRQSVSLKGATRSLSPMPTLCGPGLAWFWGQGLSTHGASFLITMFFLYLCVFQSNKVSSWGSFSRHLRRGWRPRSASWAVNNASVSNSWQIYYQGLVGGTPHTVPHVTCLLEPLGEEK